MKYAIIGLILLLTACQTTNYSEGILETNNKITNYEYTLDGQISFGEVMINQDMDCIVDRKNLATQCRAEVSISADQDLSQTVTYYATPDTVYFKERGQWYKQNSNAETIYDPMKILATGIQTGDLKNLGNENINGEVYFRLGLGNLVSELAQLTANQVRDQVEYTDFSSDILVKKSNLGIYEANTYMSADTENGPFALRTQMIFTNFNGAKSITIPSGVNSAISIS